MNWELLANSKLIENLGWTLLHSLWQIALIAFVLLAALRILREFSANARYTAAVFALVFASLLPVATFVQLARSEARKASHATGLHANSLEPVRKDSRAAEDFKALAK